MSNCFDSYDQNEVARAIELRDIVTSLGPAYIKLGQALSIRPDILSPAAMTELQKLCDKVNISSSFALFMCTMPFVFFSLHVPFILIPPQLFLRLYCGIPGNFKQVTTRLSSTIVKRMENVRLSNLAEVSFEGMEIYFSLMIQEYEL